MNCKNGGLINPENPSKTKGFSKQARKKTKGKKPRIITDQANYLKLSFYCHVLKFLWCDWEEIFWPRILSRFHKSDWLPWRPGLPFGNWSAVYRNCLFAMCCKSCRENWTLLGMRGFCCWQIGKLVTNRKFRFAETVIQNTIKPSRSSFFLSPSQSLLHFGQ